MVDVSAVALQVAGDAASTSPSQARMLDAARAEFISHGIERTSVATIARRAGVSRPTLYRQCGDKDQIVSAVIRRDVIDFFTRAYAATVVHESVEDKMVEMFVLGMGEARTHPLVKALKEFESEAFNRRLVEMDTSAYQTILAIAATAASNEEYSPAALERALDFMLRVTATLLIAPSKHLPTGNDEEAREFATRFLVPVLQASR